MFLLSKFVDKLLNGLDKLSIWKKTLGENFFLKLTQLKEEKRRIKQFSMRTLENWVLDTSKIKVTYYHFCKNEKLH